MSSAPGRGRSARRTAPGRPNPARATEPSGPATLGSPPGSARALER